MLQRNDNDIDGSEIATELDDISVSFSGKYILAATNNILESMKRSEKINVIWSYDNQNISKKTTIYFA
jgi:hypothetical protein